MQRPIEFNFETQQKAINDLRTTAEVEEETIERLSNVIAFADLNLEATIAAARENALALVETFKSSSRAADTARTKSFEIVKQTRATLRDDLMGRSFTLSGEVYARGSLGVPISCALDPIVIGEPGVDATVLDVELPLGTGLWGLYSNYYYYSRLEHEGYDGTYGKTYDLPENPAHDRLYHAAQDRDFMFELDPCVIFTMGEEARRAAGIVGLDEQRPDTAPILAHLSRIALIPSS